MARTLESLADAGVLVFGDGYRTKSSELSAEGIPVLRVADVLEGVIVPSMKDRVSVDYEKRMGAKKSRPGDVLITTKGTVGRAAFVPEGFPEHVYSPQLCFLRVTDSEQMNSRWLYQWVRSSAFMDQARSVMGQTDMAPYVSLGDLKKFKVDLPPMAEQRRIAGVLGAIDDLIDTNEKLSRSTEALARCIAERAPRCIQLGELASIDNARAVVPMGATAHYSLPAFDSSVTPELVDGATIKSNKHPIEKSMVLVSRLNPHIPRIWMVYPGEGVSSVASTEFVPLVEHEGVSIESVFSVVSSPAFVTQLRSHVTGTTGSHQRVDKKALLSIDVPDVRLLLADQQKALVSLVCEASASRRAATTLRRTRDELLPLLMSGRIRVREAEELVKERVG